MSRENLERFLKEVAKDNDLQSKITNHIDRDALIALGAEPVSYTHLTLPTNREV